MAVAATTPTAGPGGRCFCVVCADEASRRVMERRPPRSPGHTPFMRTKPSPSNPRELFEYVEHTSPKTTPLSPKFTPMSLIHSQMAQPSPSSRLATGSPIREDKEGRVTFAPTPPTRIRPPLDESEADEEDGLINTHGSFLSGAPGPVPGQITNLLKIEGRHAHDIPPLQLDATGHFKPPDDTELLLREWNRKRDELMTEAIRSHAKTLEESFAQLHEEAEKKLHYVNHAARVEAQRAQLAQERARKDQEKKTEFAMRAIRQGHDLQHHEAELKLKSLKEKREALERARLQEEMMKKAQEEERRRKEAEAEAARVQAQRKKEEEERAAKAREAALAVAAAATRAMAATSSTTTTAAAAAGGGGGATVETQSERRKGWYAQVDVMLKELAELQAGIKSLPPDLLRLRPELDRKIILNLNQVVATQQKCQSVIRVILEVLSEASRHPLLMQHCMNTLATRLVQKGQDVAAQPTSAFPYAYVAVGLCQKCAPLTKLIRATFFKVCCFTIPRYVRRQEGWSDAQFLEAQGYEQNEGSPNGFEPEDEYRVRMGGIVMLYAAILQHEPVYRGDHPFGSGEAWTWIAMMGNMKPRRLTALILHDFLKIAGLMLSEAYPQQFRKYMAYLHHDFIARLPPQTTAADKSRLQQLIEGYTGRTAEWSGVGRRLDPA